MFVLLSRYTLFLYWSCPHSTYFLPQYVLSLSGSSDAGCHSTRKARTPCAEKLVLWRSLPLSPG